MQVTVPLVATCVMCCIYAVIAFPRDYTDSQDVDSKYDRELAAETDPDLRKLRLKKLILRERLRENGFSQYDSLDEHHAEQRHKDLRKLRLKKLRWREMLRENGMSPYEERHKASKRHDMNDAMAMLSNMKVRHIKESMELPSLRFGRWH